MIYDKLLSLYVNELGRLESNVIIATNNIIKTDSSNYALVELIKAKAVEEWHKEYFKQVLDYVKVLEHID